VGVGAGEWVNEQNQTQFSIIFYSNNLVFETNISLLLSVLSEWEEKGTKEMISVYQKLAKDCEEIFASPQV
jgi:hypothetical protein